MEGPIISFDVSKGCSHAQGFLSSGKPLGKAFKFEHNMEGYEKISELAKRLKEKTGVNPSAVYEFTGVYAMPLLAFLIDSGFTIYQISPLESAKMRKAEIRPTKNDSLDCSTIAKVYYGRPLRPLSIPDQTYSDLREMSRQYQYELGVAIEEKNRYHRCLDAVWPLFDQVTAYDSKASLNIVIKFGHPSNIKTRRGVASAIEGVLLGSHTTRDDLIEDVIEYTKTHNSGCTPNSYLVQETIEMAKRVKREKERLKEVLERMLEIAAKLPEFQLLKSIPGIKDTSALRLIAEIGDISKYNDAKALVAYIGLDPMVLQSGKNTGEHLHITKKGNKFLRCTLYLCVTNILTHYPDSKIGKFVTKKKNDGLYQKAAKIAGCTKLANIIYSMMTNGAYYSE